MILKYVDANVLNNSIFYICGPPSMLNAMQNLLQQELEIPKIESKLKSSLATNKKKGVDLVLFL
jgi:glycine betaine catabolism B